MTFFSLFTPRPAPPSDLIRGPTTTIADVWSGPRVEPEGGAVVMDGVESDLGLCATVQGEAK